MNGFMSATVEFKNYSIELCGNNCKVWVGEGLPKYEGSIDGVQQGYPDLWQHLIESKAIKLA